MTPMFGADFLANLIVWREINNILARVLIVALCAIVFAVACASVGEYRPLIALVLVGFLIFVGVRRIFRPHLTLEEILAQPVPQGRVEPSLYLGHQGPLRGLHAPVTARWPVSRR